jgi:hypothetical protein
VLSKVAQQRARVRDVKRHLELQAMPAVDAVLLPMPCPGGPGRAPLRGAGPLRCASSRRGTGVSPLTGCHPSRNTVRPAEPAETSGGPFPCPGIADPDSFTLRVNEARLAN